MSTASATSSSTSEVAPSVDTAEVTAKDRLFESADLNKNLGGRTVHSGMITMIAQGTKFILRLVSTAILARLLSPSDFGLIAMVTVVTTFVETFKDAGLSIATIQRERITHAQVSTLFWINIAISLGVMLVIAALGPILAWFYGEPRLVGVTLALSSTMVFGGAAVQHLALLRRNMQFARTATVDIVSLAVGITTGIVMAWTGFGYWSLVGMTASTAVSTSLMSFLMSGWIPGLPQRRTGVREFLKIGGFMTTGFLIYQVGRTADSILIGWLYGAQSLGIYNRSLGILLAPWHQMVQPVSNVVIPGLCRLANRPDEFKTLYQKCVSITSIASFPLAGVLAFNAGDIILLLLGPEWSSASPIFVALLPASIGTSLRPAILWLFTPLDRSYMHPPFATLSSITLLIGISIGGLWLGPVGVAAGVSLANILIVIWGIEYAIRGTFMSRWDVWACIVPAVVGSVIGAACYWAASGLGAIVASLCCLLVSVGVSMLFQHWLQVPSLLEDAMSMLKKRFKLKGGDR